MNFINQAIEHEEAVKKKLEEELEEDKLNSSTGLIMLNLRLRRNRILTLLNSALIFSIVIYLMVKG